MNSNDFCVLYSSFYGEEISCLEQLKHASFDGHELFEFIKYIEKNIKEKEYNRGIEDGKVIQEHGTVNWQTQHER